MYICLLFFFLARKADTMMWEVCAGVNFLGDLPWFWHWLQILAIILSLDIDMWCTFPQHKDEHRRPLLHYQPFLLKGSRD